MFYYDPKGCAASRSIPIKLRVNDSWTAQKIGISKALFKRDNLGVKSSPHPSRNGAVAQSRDVMVSRRGASIGCFGGLIEFPTQVPPRAVFTRRGEVNALVFPK